MTECPKNGSKLNIALPEPQSEEYWWDPESSSPSSIEEERGLSEYDCGYIDLGAETPVSASTSNLLEGPGFVENWTSTALRRSSSHLTSSPITNSRYKKYAVDRDCGICFEYAVVPCRTLCCGKIFCTEHLADWLHGPKAEGRCPNCENACSLEGSTLSLASPTRGRRNSQTQVIPEYFHSSPSTLVQQQHSNRPLTSSREQSLPQMGAKITTSTKNSSASSPTETTTTTTSSSTVDYSDTTEDSKTTGEQYHIHMFPAEERLTDSYALSWAAASRLISLVMFLMFLYKLRS